MKFIKNNIQSINQSLLQISTISPFDNTNNKYKKQNIKYTKTVTINKIYLINNASLIYLAILILVFLLSDDIKKSNLFKVGHDMFLKYFFLISLYFGQHNKNGILILSHLENSSYNNENLYLYYYILQFQFLNYVKKV